MLNEAMKNLEVLSGNELIIQGGLEAGFSLYTGYPGSPLADFFNILNHRRQELQALGIRVVLANSEANAAAMASGCKQASRHCLLAMKSMGLQVASDALSVGNFACPGVGAVVIVVGDDPWSLSTSAPMDSRFLFKHLHIPFFCPSNPQELKDWIAKARDLSLHSSVYCGLVLTTFMAEGGGLVETKDYAQVDKELIEVDTDQFDLSANVMVPPNSFLADKKMLTQRFPKVIELLEEMDLDQWQGAKEGLLGIVTSGQEYELVKEYLQQHQLLESVGLYKLAVPYPLGGKKLSHFLKSFQHLVVVEEKRGFIEEELKSFAYTEQVNVPIYGKKFNQSEGFNAYGGLNQELLTQAFERLWPVIGKSWPCQNEKLATKELEPFSAWPKRLPTFCPGCPHRETLSLLKDLRQTLKSKSVDFVTHGDVGCYSLSFLQPFKEMHNLSAMGQGGALGAGMDLFTKNPSVVLMGDSTFFHSGLTDVSNSVQLNHDITYIFLDNDNTAMTGHQMSPSTGVSVEGQVRPRQEIAAVVKSLGVEEVIEVNPSDRYFYKNLLLSMIEKKGVKAIISNKECALTFGARARAKERQELEAGPLKNKRFYQINTLVCEDCRECVEMTGCPGLTQTFDAYGPKMSIDPSICVADSYCTKLKACPSFEIVDVKNYTPGAKLALGQDEQRALAQIPAPGQILWPIEAIASGEISWRAVVTGVGGSGVTTISRVLAQAALLSCRHYQEHLDFKYVDQKGLAQRNGNVTSHLVLYHKNQSHAAVTGPKEAKLLLSPDLLDGPKMISFLHPKGKACIGDHFQVPLSLFLQEAAKEEIWNDQRLQEEALKVFGQRLELIALKDLCMALFSKTVYASAMLLGAAYQKGLLPFSYEALLGAIEQSVLKREVLANKRAFEWGRLYVDKGQDFCFSLLQLESHKVDEELKVWWHSLEDSIIFYENKKKILKSAKEAFDQLLQRFDFLGPLEAMQFVHDLWVYDRGEKWPELVNHISQHQEKIDRTYLSTLVRSFWVKDEVMVAHLMLSPVQKGKEQKVYRGQSIQKKFINRPAFDIGPWVLEFDFSPKVFMLKMMRHGRLLRKLLPKWHRYERQINQEVRKRLPHCDESELKKLQAVKGYRHIRYKKWEKLHA